MLKCSSSNESLANYHPNSSQCFKFWAHRTVHNSVGKLECDRQYISRIERAESCNPCCWGWWRLTKADSFQAESKRYALTWPRSYMDLGALIKSIVDNKLVSMESVQFLILELVYESVIDKVSRYIQKFSAPLANTQRASIFATF